MPSSRLDILIRTIILSGSRDQAILYLQIYEARRSSHRSANENAEMKNNKQL